jgi:multicomponent Na+:H+ antiporter subunit F
MTVGAVAAFIGLLVAGALVGAALLRRPSLADRIVALDLLLLILVAGIAVDAAWSADGTFLDVHVVAALLGFVSTVTAARFIEQRGAR